ncbi:MAG: DUF3179 domain-containing protein [Planctomycetia bacterium]|nr:DUF3179 domain-containing protein [Planctomycetia bacterium]
MNRPVSSKGDRFKFRALILVLSVLLVSVAAWRIPHLSRALQEAQRLGPQGFKTNGFDIPESLIADPTFVRWGVPGQITSVDMPEVWGQAKVIELGSSFRKRFLVSSSEVVGVRFNGESRAYPLRLLQWHEVVNDVVGGVPICVIYHPLSETLCVFERKSTSTSVEPPLFGTSGLILDCCLLIHDRLGPDQRKLESLWSPVDGKALFGPRSGEELQLLPFSLTTWNEWLEESPSTDVMAILESHRNYYKKEPYLPYRQRDLPRYPFAPVAKDTYKNLARVQLTRDSGQWRVAIVDEDQFRIDNGAYAVSSWFAVHARELEFETPR